jgi:hypothetical protein
MADYASEQTLQELLAEAKAMNANLQKMAAVLGKTPTATKAADSAKPKTDDVASGLMSQASKFLPMLGPAGIALKGLSIALDLVTKAFNVIGSILGGLVSIVGNVAGALTAFAKKAMDGEAKISDMVGMFGTLIKQIPYLGAALGPFADGILMIVQRMETTFLAFQNLTNSGISFGGSLIDMRLKVQASGLSIKDFTEVARSNADIFATMGGDTQKGADRFLKAQASLFGSGSTVVDGLSGLGVSAQQGAEYLAMYYRSQGSMNKQGLDNTQKTSEGVLQMVQQFQYLAESTGKRRDQIEAEIKAAQNEANFQAYLATLSTEKADEAREALTYALAKGGKEAGDMVKTGLMTGVVQPMTEAQMRTDALTGGALTRFTKGVIGATGTYEQRMKQMDGANAQFAAGTKEYVDQFRTVNALQMAQGKEAFVNAEIVANSTRAMENGKLKSTEKQIAEGEAQRAKISKLSESEAAALAKAQNNIKNFGAAINTLIDTLIGPFVAPLLSAAQTISAMFTSKEGFGKVQELAEKFSIWLKPWVDGVVEFFSRWFKAFTAPDAQPMELLKKMFEEAKKNMRPILDSVFQVLGSVLKEVIKSMFITVLDAILSLIPGYDLAKKGLKALSSGFSENGTGGAGVGDYEVDALGNTIGVSPETPASAVSVETAKPPPADNAKLARDWAWSIMSGQTEKSAPASIKDQVDSIISSDTNLKQQAEKYKADMAKRREDEARRQSETSKSKQEKPVEEEKPKEQKPAATPAQESPTSTANVLNTQMAQLIRASLETAEHTKRTASILASKGNLLNG